MDLPSRMPLSRYSKTTICPVASSVFGFLSLHSHVRCKNSCSGSAGPLQLLTSHSSFCWRYAWSDNRALSGLERCLNDGGAFSAKVDSGARFKILSPHAPRFQTNRSKIEQHESISGSETGRQLESGKFTKPAKLTRSPRVLESSGEGIKRLKKEAQSAVEPSGINTGNKGPKTRSVVSRAADDTAFRDKLPSSEGSGVTTETLGSNKSSQTFSLGAEINKDGVKMESVNKLSEQYGIKLSKRSKKNPVEVETFVRLNLCSRYANLHGALEIYDKVKREGLFRLTQHSYNVLLYICSGAASGSLTKGKSGRDEKNSETATLHKSKPIDKGIEKSEAIMDMHLKQSSDALSSDPVHDAVEASSSDEVYFTPEEMNLAARRGLEIYEDMLNANVPFNEATYTAIARLAVAKGDADLAFEMVKRMAARNIAPKLRSYGPALLSFCDKNEVQKAFEVDDHMLSVGVLPDEGSLEALLKVSFEAGLEGKVYSLLQRLRRTGREFSSTTVKTIERWFNSESAAIAGRAKWDCLPSKEELKTGMEAVGGGWHGLGWLGKGKWKVRRTNVNKLGSCLSCGEQLCTIDIDPRETENFAKSVAELACQREQKANDFKAFQEWLNFYGPFDAVIDGANIGLYNPQLSQGFNFHQLMAVVKAIRGRTVTGKPPLIIVHCRHTNDRVSLSKKVQEMLKRWIQAKAIYLTPKGSNDDWYWLYAAVKSKCLLVTNDEMRDHIFELLGNDFFPKWKERHQVRFTFEIHDLELHMPPPYSILMQESLNGSWHVPQIGGDDIKIPREWLCVTRPDPVSLAPASTNDISCQQNGLAESHMLHPEELNSVLKAGLKMNGKNTSQEGNSSEESERRADVCSPASRSPSRASHPRRKRSQSPSHSSPTPSTTILKLEAAEKLAESAIDFQI